MFKLRFDDEGVPSYCEQNTIGAVEDDADALTQKQRPISRARSRAMTTTDQRSRLEPSQTVSHPSSPLQQELTRQQERILDLEVRLSRTQDELRRALQGDISASPVAPVDSVVSHGAGSSTGNICATPPSSSRSNASVSEAAANLSHLQLQHDLAEEQDDAAAAAAEQSLQEQEDHEVDAIASTASEQDSDAEEGSTSRRSGRQRKAVDHLSYPASTPTPAAKRKLGSTTSISSDAKKIKRQSNSGAAHEERASLNVVVHDSDEVQIAALVSKLQEAHSRRSGPALDSCSPTTLAKVVQHVVVYGGSLASGGVSIHLQSPPMTMQQCAVQITTLINTSTSLKMLGYFLRAVLAHKLKQTSERNYCRLARETLDIKSPADLAAYPAFFDFVQQRCSTVVATMFLHTR